MNALATANAICALASIVICTYKRVEKKEEEEKKREREKERKRRRVN